MGYCCVLVFIPHRYLPNEVGGGENRLISLIGKVFLSLYLIDRSTFPMSKISLLFSPPTSLVELENLSTGWDEMMTVVEAHPNCSRWYCIFLTQCFQPLPTLTQILLCCQDCTCVSVFHQDCINKLPTLTCSCAPSCTWKIHFFPKNTQHAGETFRSGVFN